MQIRKSLLIPAPSDESAIFTTRTTYVEPEGERLLQEYAELTASDTFGWYYNRWSDNNGTTWSKPELAAEPERLSNGTLRRGEFAFLMDPQRGRVIRFYNLSLYPGFDQHTVSVGRFTTIQIEVSDDKGKTFSAPEQLIIHGGTAKAWAPDVEFECNSIVISFCQPIIDRRGRIILPAYWRPVLVEGAVKPFPMEAVCIFGETDESAKISWSIGNRVAVDRNLSSRGLGEPTISELQSGRLLMICRGSNASIKEIPARKWMTFSDDGGLNWKGPEPLGFDTGELFFSPATGSRLIRSSQNGKLYWIGNIVPENPEGNRPRYPLCIAEVDEQSLSLRKKTLEPIDTRNPDDTSQVQLSNFHVYEDRVTKEFVLVMARIFERSETSLSSPAYEYRLSID